MGFLFIIRAVDEILNNREYKTYCVLYLLSPKCRNRFGDATPGQVGITGAPETLGDERVKSERVGS